MIISQTPFRISFFGGGTDYPLWYREHGGAVLSTTIDKYCYISVRYLPPFFQYKHRIVYSNIEMVNTPDEIKHPVVRAALTHFKIDRGLEIHHDGDLPARAGIGSSSAFTVGILNALHAFQGRSATKDELATQAVTFEQDILKEAVGSQDQIAAAYGGFNRIDFHANGSYAVTPVTLSTTRSAEFQSHLLMFFTGLQRNAPDIALCKLRNFKNRASELKRIRASVDEALGIIKNERAPLAELGRYLHDCWELKRTLAEGVSNPVIDEIYDSGLEAGALGGKILGAGGGGFILFLAEPHKHAAIKERLKKLVNVSFAFSNYGSRIVMHDPNL